MTPMPHHNRWPLRRGGSTLHIQDYGKGTTTTASATSYSTECASSRKSTKQQSDSKLASALRNDTGDPSAPASGLRTWESGGRRRERGGGTAAAKLWKKAAATVARRRAEHGECSCTWCHLDDTGGSGKGERCEYSGYCYCYCLLN